MSAASDMSPDELARACADSMWSTDRASQALGMEILEVSAGRAVLSMRIREDMTNGQHICHGGYMFTLADSTFAFACNGYNQFTVAAHCSISFLSAVKEGELLIATGEERQKSTRSGIYDITVRREDGTVVAEFRGNSRTVKGQHIPDGE